MTSASASVLIVPSISQVSLDPRFTTRDANALTGPTNQRQALIGLATSATLEQRVAAALPQQTSTPLVPGSLLSRVTVKADGDLLEVRASAPSADEALRLADTWARTYERLVAEIYSRDNASMALIEQQIGEAQQRYDEAQLAVEQLLGSSEQMRLSQEINSLRGLLDGSTSAGTDLYTQYLSRTHDLDLLLLDARTLRAQLGTGTDDDLANSLAILALRARASGGAELPIQLRFDEVSGFVRSNEDALSDIDGLIAALQDQRDQLAYQAERLSQSIASGKAETGLKAADVQRYAVELALLQQQVEELTGRQRILEQRRDIAFASLELLQRKRDEQQIASVVPQVSVRFISTSLSQPSSALGSLVILGMVGMVLGFVAGAFIALVLTFARRQPAAMAPQPHADVGVEHSLSRQ